MTGVETANCLIILTSVELTVLIAPPTQEWILIVLSSLQFKKQGERMRLDGSVGAVDSYLKGQHHILFNCLNAVSSIYILSNLLFLFREKETFVVI